MGLRESLWFPFFGVPRGPLGSVGPRVMPFMVRPLSAMMAGELALQPDDELLEVGCGSAMLLAEQSSHIRYVAGLDASDIQVRMARRRLADRIAAGTAEIVLGDAMELPWEDGRFSAVSCLNCLKFVSDPLVALREMARVLRPGGRAARTFDEDIKDPARSGAIDAFGQWQWSTDDACRMMEEAGFAEVSVTRTPTRIPFQLLRGVKRAGSTVPEATEATVAPLLADAAGG